MNNRYLKSARFFLPVSIHSKKISNFFRKLQDSTEKKEESEWGVIDVAHRAFEAMQGTIARQKLAAYPPNHTIEIPRNVCTFLEFDLAGELIELGYNKAEEFLESNGDRNGEE